MEQFARVMDGFTARLGLGRLPLGSSGAVSLSFERVGRLDLEAEGERVFVTLARPGGSLEVRPAALLSLCHWNENHPWILHAGMKGSDWLSLTAVLPEREFDLPTLERLLPFLSGLLDSVGARTE